MKTKTLVYLGAFFGLFLIGGLIGESRGDAPGSVSKAPIRIVDNRQDPHFGSITFDVGERVATQVNAYTQVQLKALFPVWVGDDLSRPTVSGQYRVESSVIRFVPRYTLVPNLLHVARINYAHLAGESSSDVQATLMLRTSVQIPKTTVSAIYPSGDVPENLLRFYVHFSSSMQRGGVYEHIQLKDEHGKVDDRAFLKLEPELWDLTAQRLTLLFDPGRIKRGLRPRADLGSALRESQTYTLVIGEELEDADGIPLAARVEHRFQVVGADRVSPNPEEWTIEAPDAQSRGRLSVLLDESVDRALLGRMLTVEKSNGDQVAGEVTVAPGERQWVFMPEAVWTLGEYFVRADVRLEDRAGNRLDGLFDQEMVDTQVFSKVRGDILLGFTIK